METQREAGYYYGQVTEMKFGTYGASDQKLKMVFRLKLTHFLPNGPMDMNAAECLPAPEEAMIVQYFHTDGCARISQEKLMKLGFNGDFGAPRIDAKFYFPGVPLHLKHRLWQDKPQEEWEFMEWRLEVSDAPQTEVSRFNAKFRQMRELATPPASPPPAAPVASSAPADAAISAPAPAPAPPAPRNGSQDDLPF